ncbi:negative elongation factor E [Ctenocephalides felis]|uniref:negative elongation factor E-like n=1 Tax=Ctenocephalides felis TaxID=7515 RepID=UPI000E6E1B7F|nr:negative elongation factor E-like [Ctenocephalides felis]XP_026468855.1 negative elongation factor E [Ctenocephalides felis]
MKTVYIHFPSNLTEEEHMLQAKYQKLKKKKKALQALKAPKPEPEKPVLPKRPADARDAKEVARKLIKSGAIPAIPKPSQKPAQLIFKRPRGQERKRIQPEKVSSYQPFQSNIDTNNINEFSDKATPRAKNLYDHFVSERDKDERGLKDSAAVGSTPTVSSNVITSTVQNASQNTAKRTGNTVYVSGYQVTQEFLQKNFSEFGNILYISMEIEKHRGFVTFDKVESAERAIKELDNAKVGGIDLKVSLARRQPQIEPINDATSSAAWATLAANQSQKGSHKDTREIVTYESMDIFD